ncbi:MAG: hypothetical protein Q9183_007012 [Haloplaca sp. 2 TL-2023]
MEPVDLSYVFSERPLSRARPTCSCSTQGLLTVKDLWDCGIYLPDTLVPPREECLALDRNLCRDISKGVEDPGFDKACEDIRQRVQGRDKATLLAYITELIVYRAEPVTKCLHGVCLREEFGRRWDQGTPLINGCVPQPDYCVGFATEAFDKEEMGGIRSWLAVSDRILDSATESVHFPFLTCMVVGCDDDGEQIDRQNTYCASVAVSSLVRIFMLCGLQRRLHGVTLAYSITHSSEWVKVYGHYPLVHVDENGQTRVTFCRYRIAYGQLGWNGGATKWQGWRLTKNIYFIFAKIHFDRIRLIMQEIDAKLKKTFGHLNG